MITPIEIQSKTFRSGGLGYDKKDVDGFLREVLRSYEQVYRENMELNDKVAVLTEGIQYYKTIEKTLQKALVLAEKTAEDTKMAALEKAKAIEKEAKVRSQLIVADAKNELEHIHNQTIQLIQQYEKYKCQFKHLAQAQMELVESECFNINISRLEAFIDTKCEETKQSNAYEEIKETREIKEAKEAKEAKDFKEFEDMSKAREIVKVRENRESEEIRENREKKEKHEHSESNENKEVRDIKKEQPFKTYTKQRFFKRQEPVVKDRDKEDSFFDALVQVSATSEQSVSSYSEEDYPYEQKNELESQEEFSFINLIDEED